MYLLFLTLRFFFEYQKARSEYLRSQTLPSAFVQLRRDKMVVRASQSKTENLREQAGRALRGLSEKSNEFDFQTTFAKPSPVQTGHLLTAGHRLFQRQHSSFIFILHLSGTLSTPRIPCSVTVVEYLSQPLTAFVRVNSRVSQRTSGHWRSGATVGIRKQMRHLPQIRTCGSDDGGEPLNKDLFLFRGSSPS